MSFRAEARKYFAEGRSITSFVRGLGYGPRSGAYWAIQKWLSGNRDTLPLKFRASIADAIGYQGDTHSGQRDFRVRMGR